MRRLMIVAAVLTAFSQSSTLALGDTPPPSPPDPTVMERRIVRPTPQPIPLPQPIPFPQPVNDSLCRRAPVLAQIAGEDTSQSNPRPSRWTPRDSAAPKPRTMPAAPPSLGGAPAIDSAPAPPSVVSPPSAPVVSDSAGVAASVSGLPTVSSSRGRLEASKRAPRGDSRYVAPPAPLSSPSERSSNQQTQSGQLTAGEHDDLLNPALYARYVSKFLAGETLNGIPRVDTGKALFVVVTDASGAPMPFATVTLTCSDNNSLSLTTMSDGRVAFFPELDRLGASVVMVANSPGGVSTRQRTINVASIAGAQTVRTQISERARSIGKFDLAVVIDATGSMGDEINFLKAELADIIATLARRHRGLDIRVAMVVYRDQGDEFVTRTFEFTSDMGEVQRNLSAQSAGGGGDMPEAMEVAMARAVGLNWRSDAVKSMLLVADAPPHAGDVPATWAATEVARAKRIAIVPVAASGVDDAAQYIMRAMAAATQSRYAFLTDDSGIGNSHAEPSVDCYHVTKLDSLVARILDGQISGRRIEPTPREILRTVGDYDNGRCRGT